MAKVKKSPAPSVLERVQARYKAAEDAQYEQRRRSRADVAFCDPEQQWDEADKQKRQTKGRPCLVVDRMTPFLDQVVNDQRMNRQAVDVHPVDDTGDPETAEILKGLIRHIEYDSNADFAYDTAFMSMIRGGFGFFRVFLDYETPDSFDQCIKIARIADPFTVFIDPASIEPDGSDMEWALIFQDLTKDEYREKYPDSDLAASSTVSWRTLEQTTPGWVTKDGVRVAEYYEKTRVKRTICQLMDGTIMDAEALPDDVPVVQRRDSYRTEIRQYVLNAVEVLAETVFPGEWIPVFPVYGQELITDGERIFTGLVARLKDVQRMVNYWKSAQTEMIALAPRAPWIGPRGFRGDMEKQWATANTENWATLEYEPVVLQGQVMPPPQRSVQEPAIGAITNALLGTEEDLKAVTGMYDPSLGQRSSDQSGVAIRQLQHQGQLGNFHFADNLSRAIRHLGRVLVGLIPKVYDTPRVLRVIGVDDQQKTVRVNQPTGDVDPKTGVEKIYDLTAGRYDVVVTSGPSYATRRQENVAVMMDLLGKLPPQMAANIADLMAAQMDTPIAKEVADRLKRMIPPELTQKEGDGQQQGQQQLPPQAQAQMQQLMQQHEQLTQALHAAQDQLDQQTAKVKADAEMQARELDSKERIALLQSQTQIAIAELNAQSKEAQTALQEELAFIKHRMTALLAQRQEAEEPQEPAGPDVAGQEAL